MARCFHFVGKTAEAIQVLHSAYVQCFKALGPTHRVTRTLANEVAGRELEPDEMVLICEDEVVMFD